MGLGLKIRQTPNHTFLHVVCNHILSDFVYITYFFLAGCPCSSDSPGQTFDQTFFKISLLRALSDAHCPKSSREAKKISSQGGQKVQWDREKVACFGFSRVGRLRLRVLEPRFVGTTECLPKGIPNNVHGFAQCSKLCAAPDTLHHMLCFLIQVVQFCRPFVIVFVLRFAP